MEIDKLEVKLNKYCGVPKRYVGLKLDEMDDYGDVDYRKQLDKIDEIGSKFREDRDLPIYLFLYGKFGSGKTRSAVWLLEQFYRRLSDDKKCPIRPLFIKASDLGEYRFQRKWVDDDNYDEICRTEKIRKQLFEGPLLVVDDVARIAGYKGEFDFFEQVVESRYDNELSVILTSSTSPTDFDGRFNDYLSYFDEMLFTGKSRRERSR